MAVLLALVALALFSRVDAVGRAGGLQQKVGSAVTTLCNDNEESCSLHLLQKKVEVRQRTLENIDNSYIAAWIFIGRRRLAQITEEQLKELEELEELLRTTGSRVGRLRERVEDCPR